MNVDQLRSGLAYLAMYTSCLPSFLFSLGFWRSCRQGTDRKGLREGSLRALFALMLQHKRLLILRMREIVWSFILSFVIKKETP